MPFTAATFGRKLATLRTDFGQELNNLAEASGIAVTRLIVLESGQDDPTGDELLILADCFRKDFRFFISDEATDPDDGVELLFREHGGDLSPSDRIAIAEFAYLCRCQAALERELGKARPASFKFQQRGSYFKQHGKECAEALRLHLKLGVRGVPRDLFAAMRDLGIKVFRRKLENSDISGLFMNHPEAGLCILVNLAEGMARQRFSAAHELGHALLDKKRVTFSKVGEWDSGVLVEVRANAFASSFLMPASILSDGDRSRWSDPREVTDWAGRLRVSVPALISALYGERLIDETQRASLKLSARRPADDPPDPELEGARTPAQAKRWHALFERGLSKNYVDLCFEAHAQGIISRGLLSEMLLATPSETKAIASLFGRSVNSD